MRYVLEYRARVYKGKYVEKEWFAAYSYDTLEEAERVRADCVRLQRRGTNDWRVRSI